MIGNELDFMVGDLVLGNNEQFTFPRDTNPMYIGRLVSMFLLSFENEKYILPSA